MVRPPAYNVQHCSSCLKLFSPSGTLQGTSVVSIFLHFQRTWRFPIVNLLCACLASPLSLVFILVLADSMLPASRSSKANFVVVFLSSGFHFREVSPVQEYLLHPATWYIVDYTAIFVFVHLFICKEFTRSSFCIGNKNLAIFFEFSANIAKNGQNLEKGILSPLKGEILKLEGVP